MTTLRLLRSFPLSVRLLLVNQLGVNTGFYLLIPYLATHLGRDLGLSAAVVGVVLGVRNLSQQGLFLIGGSASDRLGARTVIIAGCGLRTVGFGLFALGDSLAVLLAASVLSGLAGALFNPAVRAYLAVAAADRRAEAFSLFNVFANTGALLGPLLGSALLVIGFRVSAVVAALVFAVLTIAQALVLPAQPVTPSGGSVLGDWRECLTNRRFVAFTLALTGMFALQNQLYLVLPMQAEWATGQGGAVAAVFLVSTVASLLLQVRVTQWCQRRLRRGVAIAAGLALMGAAFLVPLLAAPLVGSGGAPGDLLTATARLAPVLLAVFTMSLGLMVCQPFVLELIPAFGRDGLSGTYFGVFYLVSGVVAAGGNALVGWASTASTSTGLTSTGLTSTGSAGGVAWPAWLLCAAAGLASAATVRWLDRRGAVAPPADVEMSR
ncbi:putative arabinose efflux permease, MFS family [Streptoalloteichus tenebrarius]|uniref:Arabinose efflux permease, MFS family n=1 Tax=Streptoalloteichus tenebrarius (strain ATCC 17920 / DSM 40477 / JCM 4838 / CBS 697.72 / NBRC 16177 / NCIMB 11028 / NRRL B-12390 / A12253. 1 / ISP 5477) TaxID=1933 RepID=A0ABT1HPC0_STRSD|nr:MFS transporter [Streptoalloteichus tenebrarius]MCP2257361.1 putative arabinose efflux permease, MFS family [Streptoalloteichus tenebrarius]BFF04274.1 MFS transporter [Streptoalloteichus tenebrarius]